MPKLHWTRNSYRRLTDYILLVIGIVIGFIITIIVQQYKPIPYAQNDVFDGPIDYVDKHYDEHLNNSIALRLHDEVRVLCWVMTTPLNHRKKAIHVKRTWGRRCNKLLFMSSAADNNLGTVQLAVDEGRNNLWAKTKEAFKYIYEHHMDEADWFFKADDDTYAIMENMRYMLYPYSPDMPIYFGCKFKKFMDQGYMSGGAGYVLSKEALRRFVEKALKDPKKCRRENDGAEDVEIGKCLENVQVIAADSRDSYERYRFLPFQPEFVLLKYKRADPYWFKDYAYYVAKEGFECCSDFAITFHYITPNNMYVFEYMLYHLRPYGITHLPPLPEKLNASMGKVRLRKNLFIEGLDWRTNKWIIKRRKSVL